MIRKTSVFGVMPLFFLVAAVTAQGASSDWQDSEGGAIRVLTSGLIGDEGRLRGTLEIKLKPGWKTYWKNPGPSGIPPEFDLARSPHITAAQIGFPPPERVDDGVSSWAGYTHPVTLPVTFTFDPESGDTLVDVDVFVGICETICIPFQASFLFDPGADPDNPEHAIVVERAFAALPHDARDDFGIVASAYSHEAILLDAKLPEGVKEPVLFIDGPQSHLLSMPRLDRHDAGHARFVVDLAPDGAEAIKGGVIDYTLVAGEVSVSGRIALP